MEELLDLCIQENDKQLKQDQIKNTISSINLRAVSAWREKSAHTSNLQPNDNLSQQDSYNPLPTDNNYGSQSCINDTMISRNRSYLNSGQSKKIPEINTRRKYNVFAKSYLSSLNQESFAKNSEIYKNDRSDLYPKSVYKKNDQPSIRNLEGYLAKQNQSKVHEEFFNNLTSTADKALTDSQTGMFFRWLF